MIKPRRVTWAGHVTLMGRRGMLKAFWNNYDAGGRILLKQILERYRRGWYGLHSSGSEMRPMASSCKRGKESWGSKKCWEFLE
jgi:hypothetical protein